MVLRLLAPLGLALALLSPVVTALAAPDAQGLPPYPVFYSGTVTVAGQPAPDGLEVRARVGNTWSGPGVTEGGRYSLTFPGEGTLAGQRVTFWLNQAVVATETDVLPSGFERRTVNLTFSTMPPPLTPTPTPDGTPQATPTPSGPVRVLLRAPPGSPTQVRRGEEFTLEVLVDPQGYALAQVQGRLTFDPRALRPVDVVVGEVLQGLPRAWEDQGNAVVFNILGGSGTARPGVVARVRFRVRGDAPGEGARVVLEELTPSLPSGLPLASSLETTEVTVGLTGLVGDLNADGVVDIRDLSLLGSSYNAHQGEGRFRPQADLNADGVVDRSDLAALAANYGSKE
mgnify:CR=1 FL=1